MEGYSSSAQMEEHEHWVSVEVLLALPSSDEAEFDVEEQPAYQRFLRPYDQSVLDDDCPLSL